MIKDYINEPFGLQTIAGGVNPDSLTLGELEYPSYRTLSYEELRDINLTSRLTELEFWNQRGWQRVGKSKDKKSPTVTYRVRVHDFDPKWKWIGQDNDGEQNLFDTFPQLRTFTFQERLEADESETVTGIFLGEGLNRDFSVSLHYIKQGVLLQCNYEYLEETLSAIPEFSTIWFINGLLFQHNQDVQISHNGKSWFDDYSIIDYDDKNNQIAVKGYDGIISTCRYVQCK